MSDERKDHQPLDMNDVYTIRDAATEIGDTDLSWDLHEVGDKIAELIKLRDDV